MADKAPFQNAGALGSASTQAVTIPVIEETLAVHKTIADNGGVRLQKSRTH